MIEQPCAKKQWVKCPVCQNLVEARADGTPRVHDYWIAENIPRLGTYFCKGGHKPKPEKQLA